MKIHHPIGQPAPAAEPSPAKQPEVWRRRSGFIFVNQRGQFRTDGYQPPAAPSKDPNAP